MTVTTKGVWPEKDEMANLIIPEHMQVGLQVLVVVTVLGTAILCWRYLFVILF